MNIRLPDYFSLVDFENRTTKEQVKYILFFVTVVAGLRKDMTPRIIAQRLNDQDTVVSESVVADILVQDKKHFSVSPYEDKRDRLPGEIPYVITDAEQKKLIREANLKFAKVPSWKKPSNIIFVITLSGFTIALLWILTWHLATPAGVDNLSWAQFTKRLKMKEISQGERAKYFLYFITEHIKMREDMTPDIISDRLRDTKLGVVDAKTIEAYFNSHPDEVMPSLARSGAYKITPDESRKILALLQLKLPPEGDSISFAWIANHVHISGIISFFIGLGGLIGVCIAVGHYTAKWAVIDKELLFEKD